MAIQNEKIKQRIAELGLSLSEVSEMAHVPKSTLHRYVTGQRENIPLPVIESLAKALGVSPAYLMGWEDNPEQPALINDDEPISILNRAAKRMTPEQRNKLLEMAKVMFKEEFFDK